MNRPHLRPLFAAAGFGLLLALATLGTLAAAGVQPPNPLGLSGSPEGRISQVASLLEALVRLPVAAALGAALAFRPRRRGTPPRAPAVIQTQIVLAVLGSLIMLIVGASLARAFGIVGAAGLIRYRAKIDDPKDAAVMLATLGVGLATGVGLYLLAAFATVFILGLLLLVESLHEGHKLFELKVKSEDLSGLRSRVESLLARNRIEYELRTASEHEVCYAVKIPLDGRTDRLSNAILRLDPKGATAVEWDEKKDKS